MACQWKPTRRVLADEIVGHFERASSAGLGVVLEHFAPAGDAGVGGDFDEDPGVLEDEGLELGHLDVVVGADGGGGVAALGLESLEAEERSGPIEQRLEP